MQNLLGAARLFAIGVGSAPNRFLLGEMGHLGRGFTRYIDPTEPVEAVAQELAQRLQSPVLTDIHIDWGDLRVSEVMPQRIPDLFAGQSVRIQGQYRAGGQHQVNIHALVNGRKASLPLHLQLPETRQHEGKSIALVWARAAIKERMRLLNTPKMLRNNHDLTDKTLQEQITQLGLAHSLVTRWTAFIAVSEKIYNLNPSQTQQSTVPLAHVKGVNHHAYGQPQTQTPSSTQPQFSGHAAPEPAFMFGLLLMFIVFLVFVWKRETRA